MAGVILCIDDNVLALTSCKCVLENAGYEGITAKNVTTARRLFTSRLFDLVITDHYLGKSTITGDALAGQFKQSRPQMPVLRFSAVAEAPMFLQHIDGVVRKTDGVADLLRHIELC